MSSTRFKYPGQDGLSVPSDMPDDPGESYRGARDEGEEAPARCESAASEDEIITLMRPPGEEAVKMPPPDVEPGTPPEPVRIQDRYTLHRVLGTGAQGEVWRATQKLLRRTVAVKVLHPDRTGEETDPEEAARRTEHFRQEALLAGNLEHPNIIPVHDLVTDSRGRPALVMKEIRGRPWLEMITREFTGPDPEFLSRHIPILMSVTQAVAFAHSRGVVHRDLKPSQVLIGQFGEVLLTDWGLAIVVGGRGEGAAAESLWRRGIRGYPVNPAGTPAYMAPEQTVEGLEKIGPWTDVFLLGGILYFLLTGTPPYVATHSKAAFLMARECEIEPPEERAPELTIPAELSQLAMRALASDPGQRIGSAGEFHAALQDYLSGAGKRRESMAITEAVQKHCRETSGYAELAESQAALARAEGLWPENPQIGWLRSELTSLFADLALTNNDLVLAEIQARMLPGPAQRTEVLERVQRKRRQLQKTARERRLALSALGAVIILFLLGIGKFIQVEARARDQAEMARARTEEARRQALSERNFARREQYYSGIGFADAYARESRPGKAYEMLVERIPPELRQWEWGHLLSRISADDMVLLRAHGAPNDIYRAEFSPDGERIVTGQRNGTMNVWEARSGRLLYTRALPYRRLWVTRFSPDGKQIIVTSFEGKASILEAATGRTELDLDTSSTAKSIMRGGSFSPDGGRVVTASSDKVVRIWDSRTGKVLHSIAFAQIPYDVAFTPDGTRVAVTTVYSGQAFLCDATSGTVLQTYTGHGDSAYSVAVSPDGRSVLTTCRDRMVRVFDLESGKLRHAISSPTNSRPNSASFSPDSRRFAFTCENGECMIYDAATGRFLGKALGAPEMYYAAFHPSGHKFLTTSFSEVRLWDLQRVLAPPAEEIAKVPEDAVPERIRQISFPLDREILWSGRDAAWRTTGTASLFRTRDRVYAVEPFDFVISPDGTQRIEVSTSASEFAKLRKKGWDRSETWKGGGKIFNAAFSRSGKLAATGSYRGNIKVWDTATWKEVGSARGPGGAVWTLDFSPDESLVAFGSHSGGAVIWDRMTKKVRFTIQAHPKQLPVVMVRFSPDGDFLLTCSSDHTAKLWNTATGKLVNTFSGHNKGLLCGEFSPDGKRILTASFDNTAKLWDVESGRELLTVFRVPNRHELMRVTFSGDGRRALFTTDKRELYETEVFPWKEQDFPGKPETPFPLRVELWKRQHRLSAESTLNDITWTP